MDQKHKEYYDAIWGEVEKTHQPKQSPKLSKNKKKKTEKRKEEPKALTVNAACPLCNYVFSLSVPRSSLNSFSFICPHCGKKVAVKTKFLSEKAKAAIIFAIAIPAAAVIGYFLFSYIFA